MVADEKETSYHIFEKCPATMLTYDRIFSLCAMCAMNHEHLCHVVHPVFYSLQGPVRGFFDLWFYRDVHWAKAKLGSALGGLKGARPP